MSLNTLRADFLKSASFASLNKDQQLFCDLFFQRKNLFLSGPAGTGKSFLINELCDFLNSRDYPIAKTATTGIASLNLQGSTIYSFAGIGLGDEDKEALVARVRKYKAAKRRILQTQALVIDEISMMSAELFDKLDYLFKTIRGNKRPWGGVQLIVSGDFGQLSFIQKGIFEKDKNTHCFNALSWKEAEIILCELRTLIRQDENSEFAQTLQKIRMGEDFDETIFNDCFERPFPSHVEPIRIFCLNVDIDKYNKDRLKNINSPSMFFYAQDSGEEKMKEALDRSCQAPKILELKKGAQVMLLTNLNVKIGLVNGSMGKINSFTTEGVVVNFFNGLSELIQNNDWEIKEQIPKLPHEGRGFKYKTIAKRTQIPLKLSYATSVNKSQGLSLDYAEIDLSKSFGHGMIYTALSRLRSIEGLKLIGFDKHDIVVNQECINYYKNIK